MIYNNAISADLGALMNGLSCACDSDGNESISYPESQVNECIEFQMIVFGQNLDQALFEKIDQDNNNEIDEQEFTTAAEHIIADHQG